jgi:hypothetical protein
MFKLVSIVLEKGARFSNILPPKPILVLGHNSELVGHDAAEVEEYKRRTINDPFAVGTPFNPTLRKIPVRDVVSWFAKDV